MRAVIARRYLATHNRPIDLRSDTVTKPTQAMRAAMQVANVGDDVFGEDPTVNLLEATAAKLTGKDAALYVASGTMSNLLAILAHAPEFGSEVICGHRQHTYLHEQGGSATLAGVHTRVLPNLDDGTLAISAVLDCLREDDPHYARPRLVMVENTHNDCGGVPLPLAYLSSLKRALASHPLNVPLHMDGARAGNAAVALNVTLGDVCAAADSVSICLSKGMGAPVGSLLCGRADVVARARRFRKALGGGWRQAGVLAAAGLIALEGFADVARRDHALARKLASGMGTVPGVRVLGQPATNMVYFELDDAGALARLQQAGVLVTGGRGETRTRCRAVVHCDVAPEQIGACVAIMKRVC